MFTEQALLLSVLISAKVWEAFYDPFAPEYLECSFPGQVKILLIGHLMCY